MSLRQDWKTERLRYRLTEMERVAQNKLDMLRAIEYSERMRAIFENAKKAQLAKEKSV